MNISLLGLWLCLLRSTCRMQSTACSSYMYACYLHVRTKWTVHYREWSALWGCVHKVPLSMVIRTYTNLIHLFYGVHLQAYRWQPVIRKRFGKFGILTGENLGWPGKLTGNNLKQNLKFHSVGHNYEGLYCGTDGIKHYIHIQCRN